MSRSSGFDDGKSGIACRKRAKEAWEIVIVQVSNAAVRDDGSLSVDVYRTTGKKFL